MLENRCEILFTDDDDEYGCELDINRVDCLLHALNQMRSDYCVHSPEFKTISYVFDFLLFVYDNLKEKNEDEIDEE